MNTTNTAVQRTKSTSTSTSTSTSSRTGLSPPGTLASASVTTTASQQRPTTGQLVDDKYVKRHTQRTKKNRLRWGLFVLLFGVFIFYCFWPDKRNDKNEGLRRGSGASRVVVPHKNKYLVPPEAGSQQFVPPHHRQRNDGRYNGYGGGGGGGDDHVGTPPPHRQREGRYDGIGNSALDDHLGTLPPPHHHRQQRNDGRYNGYDGGDHVVNVPPLHFDNKPQQRTHHQGRNYYDSGRNNGGGGVYQHDQQGGQQDGQHYDMGTPGGDGGRGWNKKLGGRERKKRGIRERKQRGGRERRNSPDRDTHPDEEGGNDDKVEGDEGEEDDDDKGENEEGNNDQGEAEEDDDVKVEDEEGDDDKGENEDEEFKENRKLSQVHDEEGEYDKGEDEEEKEKEETIPFFFVHINKTGGTSLISMLSDRCWDEYYDEDWYDENDNHHRSFHATAHAYIAEHGRKTWDDAYTFAVVRHPLARQVSNFFFLAGKGCVQNSDKCKERLIPKIDVDSMSDEEKIQAFHEWISSLYTNVPPGRSDHYRFGAAGHGNEVYDTFGSTQTSWLVDPDGNNNLVVTDTFRLEDLSLDISKLAENVPCLKNSMGKLEMERKNITPAKYPNYMLFSKNKRTRKILNKVFADDFENFGYDKL